MVSQGKEAPATPAREARNPARRVGQVRSLRPHRYRDNFERNLNVCPNCDYHRRIRASDYLSILLDEETIDETETDLRSTDPLSFPDYPARLKKSLAKAGDQDAVITAS